MKKIIILLNIFVFTNIFSQQSNKSLIVINPVHGGKELGEINSSRKIISKKLNLEVSKNLAQKINNSSEFSAILTRNSDEFVDMYDRAYISNSNNSSFFVSINCYKDIKEAKGIEIFTLSNVNKDKKIDYSKFAQSSILKEVFLDSVYSGDFKNSKKLVFNPFLKDVYINLDQKYKEKTNFFGNSVKNYLKNFNLNVNDNLNFGYILLMHHVNVPSIYFFIGNINNEEDIENLLSPEYIDGLSESIYKTIVDYKTKFIDKSNNDQITINELSLKEEKKNIPEELKLEVNKILINETPTIVKKEVVAKVEKEDKVEVSAIVKKEVVEKEDKVEVPAIVKKEVVVKVEKEVKVETPTIVKKEVVAKVEKEVKVEAPAIVKKEVVKKETPTIVKKEVAAKVEKEVKVETPANFKKEVAIKVEKEIKKESPVIVKKEVVNNKIKEAKVETQITTKKEIFENTISKEIINDIKVNKEEVSKFVTHIINEVTRKKSEVKYFLSNVEIKELQESLFFETNEIELEISELIKLNTKIDILKKHEDLKLLITCHTDSKSSFDFNMDLSKRRASFIKFYILNNGINDNRISTEGKGEILLLNECKDGINCSDDKHKENRRAEFKIN